jgi:hypothetical protein
MNDAANRALEQGNSECKRCFFSENFGGDFGRTTRGGSA